MRNGRLKKVYLNIFFAKKGLGFTLAEVLITLGIIGVVAALTIPTLMASYQKQTYLTGIKKAYSQFNIALQQIANDYGCPGDLKCTNLFTSGTDDQTFGDVLVKYFKVIKNCQITADTSCFSTQVSSNFDGSGSRTDRRNSHYTFITADGFAYIVSNDQSNGNCAPNAAVGTAGYMAQECGSVVIDVNGPNMGPNNYGRDIFIFIITNAKGPLLYPMGGHDYITWWNANIPDGCGNSANTSGYYCTGKVLEQNWQMNY